MNRPQTVYVVMDLFDGGTYAVYYDRENAEQYMAELNISQADYAVVEWEVSDGGEDTDEA